MEGAGASKKIDNDPRKIARAVRGHWGIESSLPWSLEVVFREDESRIRKDHAPKTPAVFRHIVFNLLKREPSKRSLKRKRLIAARDNQFLADLLHP